MPLRPAAAMILLLIASSAPCQGAENAGAPTRTVLLAVGAEGAPVTRSEVLLLSKSLGLALKEASPSIRIIEYGESRFPEDLEKRMQAAEEREADCWLWVGVSGEKSSPTLKVKSYDLLLQATVIEETISLEVNLQAAGTLSGKWEPLVALLLDKLQLPRAQAAATGSSSGDVSPISGQRLALLTIRALPGTVVSGLPAGKLVVGTDGTVIASLEAHASYTFRSTKTGYDPVTTRVFLDDNREVAVAQKAGIRWSADVTFSNALFPGADGRFYVIPGRLFVEAGFTVYAFGLELDNDRMVYSFPLTNFGAQFGGYFNAEDSFFRLYGSVGVFLRVIWDLQNAEAPILLDPLAPVAFQASFGTELPIAGGFRFFLELQPTLFMSRYPELMRASIPDIPFLYFFFPWGTLSLANLRFGVRWLL